MASRKFGHAKAAAVKRCALASARVSKCGGWNWRSCAATRRAPIPLDDGRLERLLAQLRYPQPYLASFGLQAALVVSGAGIPTRLAALIALRIAQPIRLGIEQCVQRLLHGTPHHPVEVALDPLVVNRDDIVQRTRCIV